MSGFCGTVPPACGMLDRNNGRMSRSTRLTSTQDPKISARSPTPKAKVKGQFETSVNPWLSSKWTLYALIDHFLRGSTSPVGTYHRPVSPMNVVVAGRVVTSDDCAADAGADVGVCGVPDVDCAAALEAMASAIVAAITTRFNIRTSASVTDRPARTSGPRRASAVARRSPDYSPTASADAPMAPGTVGSTSRPRPPRLIWPPLRPALRASSEVHSWAVPF